ncbi:hypothetical protein PG997_009564 [Apiospora hydei]|uniref:PPM-type phosphatase domain-containing protein n=1 Tax=Apiospora hydei TaxID=1337664 RepID=A0ABR1VX45_9PEZI
MKKYPDDPTPFTVPLDMNDPDTTMLSTWGSRLLYESDTTDAVPEVDLWLRRIVARCLADNPGERPNHRQLVDECEDALRQMRAPLSDRYASAPSETDEAILEFLKQYLYMPSPEPGPALGDTFLPNPFSMPEAETEGDNLGDNDQAVLVYSSNRPNEKNEDRNSDDTFFVNGALFRIVGVYDGHGGPWTSEYLSRALPGAIQQSIQDAGAAASSIPNIMASSFEQVDRSIIESAETIFAPVLSSLRYNLPFTRQRNEIAKKAAVEEVLQTQSHLDTALRAKSGSTALVAYIDRTDIHVANVGDCRAVLARRDAHTRNLEAVPLSIDQDGHNSAEYTRVTREHPKDKKDIFAGSRLFGMMPLTRSFGDAFYKYRTTDIAQYVFGNAQLNKKGHLSYHETMSPYYPLLESPPYLTATPEVISHQRSHDDVFMVMASDGVWAIKDMTNEWVVDKTMEALSNASVDDPSRYVMEELKKWKPGDDVTIMNREIDWQAREPKT